MGNANKKYAALSFDDGPSETTAQVLRVLKKYGVKASFFIIGDNVNEESEKIAKTAVDYGCELCNHSRTHRAMTELSREEVISEISYTDDIIKRISGKEAAFFRPPYIAYNDELFRTVKKPFVCGVGTDDWNDEVSVEQRVEGTLRQTVNGTIILLHDMQGNDKTVQALDVIIPSLMRDGFELVTVSELFEKCKTQPQCGQIYTQVR